MSKCNNSRQKRYMYICLLSDLTTFHGPRCFNSLCSDVTFPASGRVIDFDHDTYFPIGIETGGLDFYEHIYTSEQRKARRRESTSGDVLERMMAIFGACVTERSSELDGLRGRVNVIGLPKACRQELEGTYSDIIVVTAIVSVEDVDNGDTSGRAVTGGTKSARVGRGETLWRAIGRAHQV